jgi:hypothetical protein
MWCYTIFNESTRQFGVAKTKMISPKKSTIGSYIPIKSHRCTQRILNGKTMD